MLRYWKTKESSSFLREHVLRSAFNIYPVSHVHVYESSVRTQMCWQSCPSAHVSEPEKEDFHIYPAKFTSTIKLYKLLVDLVKHFKQANLRFVLKERPYVSMFSYLDSTHIPLDICSCMSHHCLYKCADNHVHIHMDQNLKRDHT